MIGNDWISSLHGIPAATIVEWTRNGCATTPTSTLTLPREEDDELKLLVESWDADGRALVLVPEEGRFVAATDRPGSLWWNGTRYRRCAAWSSPPGLRQGPPDRVRTDHPA
ncbi:hypothetical protein ACWGIV_34040 [Streptomyces sp. NPDC054844]